MKYLVFFLTALISFNCSPKLAPDSGWDRGRWVLVEMKGVPVQQSGGRRDASINFDVVQKSFSGMGGCNQINGNYHLDKNSIHFTDVNSTKVICQDAEFEKTFLSLLNGVDRYELKGNDLHLKQRREVVLILRAR